MVPTRHFLPPVSGRGLLGGDECRFVLTSARRLQGGPFRLRAGWRR